MKIASESTYPLAGELYKIFDYGGIDQRVMYGLCLQGSHHGEVTPIFLINNRRMHCPIYMFYFYLAEEEEEKVTDVL